MTTFQDVAAFIGQASQPELDSMFLLCRSRGKLLNQVAAAENLASLQPGDHVRITSGISPKYLVGATGVVSLHASKAGAVSIVLDDHIGKFSRGVPIGVPASCLTKVGS